MLSTLTCQTIPLAASQGSDMWDAANSFVSDLITKIMGLSTLAFVLFLMIALIFCFVSNNDRNVGVAKSWILRVVLCYIGIMSIGGIKTYLSNKFKAYNYSASMIRPAVVVQYTQPSYSKLSYTFLQRSV